jgi:predicted metal-dependent hydrolase
MKVRRPSSDYSTISVHWCDGYPEVAQALNVDSLSLPVLEPYLNAVMRRVQRELPPNHPLRPRIDWFCRQEGAHYREHHRFNHVLRKAGYSRIGEFESTLKEHFDRLLAERSLKFNCAYALAFESSGPVATAMWFEALPDILAHAHPTVARLWKWHLGEEYEHRSAIFDVYQELYSDYPFRVYALVRFVRDWRALSRDALAHLLDYDRRTMTSEEVEASRRRLKDYRRRQSRFSFPRMLRLLSPFYDPLRLREPRGVSEFLRTLPVISETSVASDSQIEAS